MNNIKFTSLQDLEVKERVIVMQHLFKFLNEIGHSQAMSDTNWQNQFKQYQEELPKELQDKFTDAYGDYLTS